MFTYRTPRRGGDRPTAPTPLLLDDGVGTPAYDRVLERWQLERAGVPVAPWRLVETRRDLVAALPLLLREGHGCWIKPRVRRAGAARHAADAAAAIATWEAMGRLPCVVEAARPVARVLAVRVRERLRGGSALATCDLVAERARDDGGWRLFVEPAMDLVARRAMRLAGELARRLPAATPVVVELFLLDDGELVVNAATPEAHPAFDMGASRVAAQGVRGDARRERSGGLGALT